MRGRARVGCSGWSYRDWRGLVYPDNLRTDQWFQYYATMFDTVEIRSLITSLYSFGVGVTP